MQNKLSGIIVSEIEGIFFDLCFSFFLLLLLLNSVVCYHLIDLISVVDNVLSIF